MLKAIAKETFLLRKKSSSRLKCNPWPNLSRRQQNKTFLSVSPAESSQLEGPTLCGFQHSSSSIPFQAIDLNSGNGKSSCLHYGIMHEGTKSISLFCPFGLSLCCWWDDDGKRKRKKEEGEASFPGLFFLFLPYLCCRLLFQGCTGTLESSSNVRRIRTSCQMIPQVDTRAKDSSLIWKTYRKDHWGFWEKHTARRLCRGKRKPIIHPYLPWEERTGKLYLEVKVYSFVHRTPKHKSCAELPGLGMEWRSTIRHCSTYAGTAILLNPNIGHSGQKCLSLLFLRSVYPPRGMKEVEE